MDDGYDDGRIMVNPQATEDGLHHDRAESRPPNGTKPATLFAKLKADRQDD